MGSYILRRLGQMLLILVLLSIFTFLLLDFIPGDPVFAIMGTEVAPEEYDRVYHELGLDKPVLQRYVEWLLNALRGDFGQSYSHHVPVIELIAKRLPVTLYLAFLAFFCSIPLGVLFGVISAVKRGKFIDTVVTLMANICACLPQFWLAVLFMFVFSLTLGWLPSFGFTFPWEDFVTSIRQTIMPVLCLSIGGVSSLTRQMRSSMLEVIRQDYVRTARSKGLKSGKVIMVHALKNALLPVITLLGLRLGSMVAGSMFVESVFTIPGMGSMLVKAINGRDMPLVQACVLITATLTCTVNLITDILYAVVDPRIRYEK